MTAYRDQAGILTIGVGHTGPEVKPGMTISRVESRRLLAQDVHSQAVRMSHWSTPKGRYRLSGVTRGDLGLMVKKPLHSLISVISKQPHFSHLVYLTGYGGDLSPQTAELLVDRLLGITGAGICTASLLVFPNHK